MRNEPIQYPEQIIEEYTWNGILLRSGRTVQLTGIKFMRVKLIVRNILTGNVRLRGYSFIRNTDLRNLVPKTTNEVCWLLDVDFDDPRPAEVQSLVEVPVIDVLRKRILVMTNDLREPREPYMDTDGQLIPNAQVRETERLFCRLKYVRSYADSSSRTKGHKPVQEELSRLMPDECDSGPAKFSLDDLQKKWRGGGVVKGGSYYSLHPLEPVRVATQKFAAQGAMLGDCAENQATVASPKPDAQRIKSNDIESQAIDLTRDGDSVLNLRSPSPSSTSTLVDDVNEKESSESRSNGDASTTTPQLCGHRMATESNSMVEVDDRSKGHHGALPSPGDRPAQRYTFLDGFCGCGGVSRGATMAGLKPIAACDFDKRACDSYKASFPTVKIHCGEITEFLTQSRFKCSPDISHLSTVCKTFSPAHTVSGKDDDKNEATLFAVSQHLKWNKPRISTLENTFGLSDFQEHLPNHEALIHMYVSESYSLRWAVINMATFGVPQTRRRLIVIAAAPGEVLTPFPPPTHGKPDEIRSNHNLLPLETIESVIQSIPRKWLNHDPKTLEKIDKKAYDGNRQAHTLTCTGGTSYHPSGRRKFTIRELAALQTFPLEHVFGEHAYTHLKSQIGNAVPPIFACRLYDQIKRSLLLRDGFNPGSPLAVTTPFVQRSLPGTRHVKPRARRTYSIPKTALKPLRDTRPFKRQTIVIDSDDETPSGKRSRKTGGEVVLSKTSDYSKSARRTTHDISLTPLKPPQSKPAIFVPSRGARDADLSVTAEKKDGYLPTPPQSSERDRGKVIKLPHVSRPPIVNVSERDLLDSMLASDARSLHEKVVAQRTRQKRCGGNRDPFLVE